MALGAKHFKGGMLKSYVMNDIANTQVFKDYKSQH